MTKRILALVLAVLCLFTTAAAQEATVQQELDRVFRIYSTLGASVAVIENGAVTFTHTYGQARPGGDPITEDTLFQVGSISKMVGNIGLMQLVEEQGISLDAELGSLLGVDIAHPAYPDIAVTLRQLMTHTASLRDSNIYDEALAGRGKPLDEVFANSKSVFSWEIKPGTERQYSNFGGGLIGSLIEKLSGQTLDQYMQERVFAPLGITAAYQAALLADDLPLADIYRMPEKHLGRRLRDGAPPVIRFDPLSRYDRTAGRLIISAPDLAKLLIALCDGGIYENTRILSESSVREMTRRQDNRGSVACVTGNGLFMNIITDNQVEGRTMYGHGGKAYGMLCAAYFDPGDRTGVVMLTNGCLADRTYNEVGMLGRAIMRVCYNRLIDPAHETQNPFAVE